MIITLHCYEMLQLIQELVTLSPFSSSFSSCLSKNRIESSEIDLQWSICCSRQYSSARFPSVIIDDYLSVSLHWAIRIFQTQPAASSTLSISTAISEKKRLMVERKTIIIVSSRTGLAFFHRRSSFFSAVQFKHKWRFEQLSSSTYTCARPQSYNQPSYVNRIETRLIHTEYA